MTEDNIETIEAASISYTEFQNIRFDHGSGMVEINLDGVEEEEGSGWIPFEEYIDRRIETHLNETLSEVEESFSTAVEEGFREATL